MHYIIFIHGWAGRRESAEAKPDQIRQELFFYNNLFAVGRLSFHLMVNTRIFYIFFRPCHFLFLNGGQGQWTHQKAFCIRDTSPCLPPSLLPSQNVFSVPTSWPVIYYHEFCVECTQNDKVGNIGHHHHPIRVVTLF